MELLGLWIVCAIAGYFIGAGKSAGGTGFLLGLLLGPIGVIAAFALDKRKSCPHCGGRLNGAPRICQHCLQSLVDDSPEQAELEAETLRDQIDAGEYAQRLAKRRGIPPQVSG